MTTPTNPAVNPSTGRWVRPVLVLTVALVCVAALIGLVVREGQARAGGTQVTLAMRGADPRDLLRGHYVAIRLVDDLLPGQQCPAQHDGDWVALAPDGNRHVAVGQFGTRDQALRHGDLAVRGSMGCHEQTVSLNLGIDRFYINQRDATDIDEALRSGRTAAAIVSVGGDGRARMVGLDVDGKRYDLHW